MSAPPSAPGTAPTGASVLVASSDSATRDLLRRILEGVEVVDASDGVEALALARRLDLDLVVLDAFLAVMDGLTVCSRIRALSEIDQPAILVLGLSSERSIEVALTSGADETLAKPLNPALLRYRARVLVARHQEERHLRLLRRSLEAAPAAVALLDARSSEYEVVHANPALLRLSGHEKGELAGQGLRRLLGPESPVAAMTELRQAMADGREARVLLRGARREGGGFWSDVSVAPVVDPAGRLTHYVAVLGDVTALVEAPAQTDARSLEDAVAERTRDLASKLAALESRRRFVETILNAMTSAMVATDARGAVTFANLAALRTLGTSLHDCVGRPVVELFGHNEAIAEVVAGTVRPHPEHRLDFPMISPGGTRFYVGMSITPAPEALRDEVGFIILFRDVAETLDIGADPQLSHLVADAEAGAPSAPPGAPAAPEGPRRVVLALRYTSPADIVRAAIAALSERHPTAGALVRLEAAPDVPEVLLDREQVTEALALLLGAVLEGCSDPADVEVRVTRTEAPGPAGGAATPAASIEITYPAVITERDLGTDPGGTARRPQRRLDFAIAEKLLEANGARLARPVRRGGPPALSVLLRAPR